MKIDAFILSILIALPIIFGILYADQRVQNENLQHIIIEYEYQIRMRDSVNAININKLDSLTAQ
jgi:hypothetical protein